MTLPLREKLNELSSEICKTLQVVFWENVYATKAIQHTMKRHPEWEDDTRAAFSETVYDIIRWWRPLWYIIGQEPSAEEKELEKLITIYLFSKKGDITALQKKRGLDVSQVLQRIENTKTSRTLRESLPDWLDIKGEKELGTRWDPVIAALNKNPDLTIRANMLKTTARELTVILRKEGIIAEPIHGNPDVLLIREKTNVFKLPSFNAGLFEVQDAASQMVSRILDPQPGMRVFDACAGEGSKTLHLAALIKNKGKIIALDTQEWRLRELRKRATKAGVDTIETRLITSSKKYKRMQGTADRLLLDVPCSGLGTLRRNPDIKWKLTSEDLDRLKHVQHDLLERYCSLLKPLGTMVYSVCSVLPSEGETQRQQFLKNHDDFRLLQEKRYWPDTDRTDGFYIALIQRTV
ncbi:MAG TPA: RsmB/NOP family class I SAM-dependent RNA methyltransferase [Candidatus Thermoplasmatota archaeon]|nr:RsmB/NOP family class I SAM-dependent RNA methyltransferase [Candidatus Thermoplasmatota archaeon]